MQPTEEQATQEQPVDVPEAPVSNETTQADESVPSMEIMDAISPLTNPVEQEQADVTQQQETTQEVNSVAQQEEQQQKPTQPKPEKAPIVGSATAYKEKGHKWKTIAQAQADLDAIVADVRANGGKYNLNSLTPSIKS